MRLPVNAPYNNLDVYMSTPFGVVDPNSAFGRHVGIDIATPVGIPLYAAVGGSVSVNSSNVYNGNTLSIESAGKWYRCLHMKSFSVTSGAVKEGQLIGYSGNTGVLAVGGANVAPHLHFDVRTKFVPTAFSDFIDPVKLLKETEMITANGLSILYRFRLGRAADKTAITAYVGKKTFDEVDAHVKASAEYKAYVPKYKAAKKVVNDQLPTELR